MIQDVSMLCLKPMINFIALTGMLLVLICLLIIHIALTPVYVFIYPPLAQITSGYFAEVSWSIFNFCLERLGGMRIMISGLEDGAQEKEMHGESALVISNHVCFIDFALIHSLASRIGMLNSCKYFVKDSVKWIPIIGWAVYLSRFPLLSRTWNKDSKSIWKIFEMYCTTRLPVWLIMYVEGTRYTPNKAIKSKDFALSRGYEPTDLVLTPRHKGFVAAIQGLCHSQHISHVYDCTIAWWHQDRGWSTYPSLLDILLCRLSKYEALIHVDRIPFQEIIPQDSDMAFRRHEDHAIETSPMLLSPRSIASLESIEETSIAEWLRKRYVRKDALLKEIKRAWEGGRNVFDAIGKQHS